MAREFNDSGVPSSAAPYPQQDDGAISRPVEVPTQLPPVQAFFLVCNTTLFDVVVFVGCCDPIAVAALGIFVMMLLGGLQ